MCRAGERDSKRRPRVFVSRGGVPRMLDAGDAHKLHEIEMRVRTMKKRREINKTVQSLEGGALRGRKRGGAPSM